MTDPSSESRITLEKQGHVLLIGFNRPKKMNAFDVAMLKELSAAYETYENDPDARCAVVFAHGEHFTAGLDLANVAPMVQSGTPLYGGSAVDPWGLHGKARTKPVVVAAKDARFAQIEIKRGIFPFGGATFRFVQVAGWGNAMRWLLTGDEFGADEAYRIGLVQEVTARGDERAGALAIAQTIAAQAPLGVRATIASARKSLLEEAAARVLIPEVQALMTTADAREGVQSFLERREAKFEGK